MEHTKIKVIAMGKTDENYWKKKMLIVKEVKEFRNNFKLFKN